MSVSEVELCSLGSPEWRLDWEQLDLDVEIKGEASSGEESDAQPDQCDDLENVNIEFEGIDLELLIKQEQEPLGGWWEEKSDVGVLSEEVGGYGWQPEPCVAKYYQPATPALIQEFETVLHNTLTPPGTPPHDHLTYSVLTTPPQEVEERVAEVGVGMGVDVGVECLEGGESELDYLVRVRAQYHLEGAESPASCSSDTTAQPPTTEEEGSSSDGATSDSDPDWALVGQPPSPRSNRGGRRSALTTLEEKRLRKKEQNKNAATRYRMKKKAEQAGIMGEEKGLLDHNTALKDQVTEIQREIKYLKSLMRDICRAKGLMK